MKQKIMAFLATILAFAQSANNFLGREAFLTFRELPGRFGAAVDAAGRAKMDSRGQLGFGTIIAAVIVVIAVMLAVIVVDQMDQTLGEPNSSALSQSNADVLDGFSSMTSLVSPLLIVAIAVVIIGLVQRLRG